MADHRAQERRMEPPSVEARRDEARLDEARDDVRRSSELPSRKGGFKRMAADATEAADRAAATQATTAETFTHQAGIGRAGNVLAQTGLAQAEEMGQGMARLLQETTRGMRAAMMLPMAPSSGLTEMQEAMAEMVAGIMRNNIRLAEDLMKFYSPQDFAGSQRKLMQQWIDAAMQGQATLLRMSRQVTDQALKPL